MEQVIMHVVHVLIGIFVAALWGKFKRNKEEQDAIKAGLQALLRGEITKAYYKYKEKGWIPLYALQSLQGSHENYQALGQNGVMDGLWKELMLLPHTPPEGKKDEKCN